MAERAPIYVYADWQGLAEPTLMGQVHRSVVRGEEVLAFEYHAAWLKLTEALVLDPRLQLVIGRQYPDASGAFGLLTDSAPDRWGRLLIQRRAALEAEAASLYSIFAYTIRTIICAIMVSFWRSPAGDCRRLTI